MKRKMISLLLVLTCLLSLTGCMCRHEVWLVADCTTPRTCEECGETEGAPLGHSWYVATCTDPKTCENCGETEGHALGHEWLDATVDAPKTCEVCGETEGEPLVINDKDKLVGTWKCEMDLAEQINTEMALDAESAEYLNFSSFEIVVYLQFNEDDTYSMYTDTDAMEETLDAAVADFAEGMARYLEDSIYAETGMEMTADEILATAGMSMDDLMAEAFPEGMAEEIAAGMTQSGKFEAKNSMLFTSVDPSYDVDPDVYETYELDGNTLSITGFVGQGSSATGGVYPLIFNKIG